MGVNDYSWLNTSQSGQNLKQNIDRKILSITICLLRWSVFLPAKIDLITSDIYSRFALNWPSSCHYQRITVKYCSLSTLVVLYFVSSSVKVTIDLEKVRRPRLFLECLYRFTKTGNEERELSIKAEDFGPKVSRIGEFPRRQ